MYERITKRLEGLGYDVDDEKDREDILREMEAGKEQILSACGVTFLPKVLEGAYIDIVCGYFLRDRLYGGRLKAAEGGVIESISEGDVTVKYFSGSELGGTERTERLIERLLDKDAEIIANRRIRW